MQPWLCAVALALAGFGCQQEPSQDGDDGEVVERDCIPPPGVTGAPRTIEEAVKLINALPMPVSLPCFVESLDRPLRAYATSNDFSAQPAQGQRSPRMFLFSGELIMSIVVDGIGVDLLEFGHPTDEGRSIKGELEFPVEAALPLSAPYDTPRLGAGTRCGTCHEAEAPTDLVDHAEAFASAALQPPPAKKVSLSFVKAHSQDCDPVAEPQRCALMTALFAHGPVDAGEFPSGLMICVGETREHRND